MPSTAITTPTDPHVLVLSGAEGALDGAAMAVARDAAKFLGADRWLAEGTAWEAEIAGPAWEVRQRVAVALGGRPIDVNVVAGRLGPRLKKLLVADMDSTIIRQECIDEMADLLGLKEQISAITERAMRGELPFESALRERVALLAGLTEADLERVWRERIELMPGARALIATMRAAGAFTALVSGGFTFFTSRVAQAVGFDVEHANLLGVADGRLTGRVAEPILGREAKLATLERYRVARGLAPAETLAVGDGANDLAMIGAAGLGVAYRAKPIVAAEAGASIRHGDLTALLWLQGVAGGEMAGS